MTALDEAVDALLDMSEEDFGDIVSTDARGELDARLCRALRHDDVLDRWGEALTVLHMDVQHQLAIHKGEKDDATRLWRGAAIRFLAGVTARKKECRAMTAERNKEEHTARWTIPAPVPKANTREARRIAGDVAVNRLCDMYPDDFKRLLAEEYARAGLPIKAHWIAGEAS